MYFINIKNRLSTHKKTHFLQLFKYSNEQVYAEDASMEIWTICGACMYEVFKKSITSDILGTKPIYQRTQYGSSYTFKFTPLSEMSQLKAWK
jgi:hypothetical protein